MKFLKALTGDPITAIAAAWDATMNLATEAIPPKENRIANFKLLFPKRYARMKAKVLRQAERWMRSHENGDYEAYADFITDNVEDKENLIRLLKDKD